MAHDHGAARLLVRIEEGGRVPHRLVPLAAGGFIYIAGSDLVPELHKESNPVKSAVQLLAMGIGVGMMLLLTRIS